MTKINPDDLEVRLVDGVQMRVLPLVVRGLDRRAVSSWEPVRLPLQGKYDAAARVIIVTPPVQGADGVQVIVRYPDSRGDVPLFKVGPGRPQRLDRRSGIERRKA